MLSVGDPTTLSIHKGEKTTRTIRMDRFVMDEQGRTYKARHEKAQRTPGENPV